MVIELALNFIKIGLDKPYHYILITEFTKKQKEIYKNPFKIYLVLIL
jgi:hypothetical protein